jgi:hypothetical protein
VRLTHYSADPFSIDRARTYVQDDTFKPRGLWVSVDGEDDWPSWCRGEEFRLDKLEHFTRLRLTPGAQVLSLCTPSDLDSFTRTYGVPVERGYAFIDWSAVARGHGGLVIAPYQWSRRLSLTWYYPWDCASGCIWDLTAVELVAR